MTRAYYTYRVRITNRQNVQVEGRDPQNDVLVEPSGEFGYRGKIKTRIQELHQAAFAGELTAPQVEQLGEALFKALFDQRLQHDFFNFYERARRERALLRIELDVDERQLPNVAALPWEFMRVPPDAGYGTAWMATDPNLVFSRRRARWIVPPPIQLAADERLRIALAVAAPKGLGPVKYKKVWETLQELAEQQIERIELLNLIEAATPETIDTILRQEPHIFHFIGHAQLEDENQQDTGQIALVDSFSNEPGWAGAEYFSHLFRRYQPGVVMLQACEGAALSESQAFVGVASQLVQQNIPVVVAMQYEVSNSTARRFAMKFYERLAKDDPVDKAAQEGRYGIALGPIRYTKRDFATPVLFMRVRDGHLFQRPADASVSSSTESRVDPVKLQQVLDTYIMEQVSEFESRLKNRGKLHYILTSNFSTEDLKTLCFDLGGVEYESLIGSGKDAKARELIQHTIRHPGRISELVEAVYRRRPNANW